MEKNKLSLFYKDFLNFTCENLFESNIEYIKEIENYNESKKLNDIKGNLIKLCKNIKIDEFNNYEIVFENHFQQIKNGMIYLTDYTYPGLLNHINNEGTISRMTVIFNCILIYLLEKTHFEPHKNAISLLLKHINISIRVTELIFLFIDIIIINIILFIYIHNIINYCKQIILLKKVFKVYEISDQ